VGVATLKARWCSADSSKTTKHAARGLWKAFRRVGGAVRYIGVARVLVSESAVLIRRPSPPVPEQASSGWAEQGPGSSLLAM